MRFPSKARDRLEQIHKDRAASDEHWTLTKLGELVGADQPAMGRLIRGERQPGLKLAGEMQRVLGIPVGEWAASANVDVPTHHPTPEPAKAS